MHYMHYKDYIHHGLAAEKTPPPLPQGGGTIWLGGGVWGSLLIYIYIYVGKNLGDTGYMAERPIKIRFASTNSGYNDSHMHGNLVILSSNFLSLPRYLGCWEQS